MGGGKIVGLVHSQLLSDEVDVWLVQSDECSDHRSLGVLVASGRPQENGGSGLNGCLTLGVGVALTSFRRKKSIQRFVDCWIETAMRRK